MKRFFKNHIFLGRMANRSGDEFFDMVNQSVEVKPDGMRWFCGMHDLDMTITCQAL